MQWVCHNGAFLRADAPLFTVANRGFKYGDGVFETARFLQCRLLLAPYHFDRLFSGLRLLNISFQFTAAQLTDCIIDLCEKNGCTTAGRVRVAAYRTDEGSAAFVIEATALEHTTWKWNEQGWQVVLHPFVRKSCDAYANLKSANYLPYVMAGQYAREEGAEECLVLNMYNRICDGSKTNLFLIKDNAVYTPALSEGCVAGVMRRAVVDFLKKSGYAAHQKGLTEDDLLGAEHLFVTNAIEGLRWVRRFGEQNYEYGVLKKLHHDLAATIYAL